MKHELFGKNWEIFHPLNNRRHIFRLFIQVEDVRITQRTDVKAGIVNQYATTSDPETWINSVNKQTTVSVHNNVIFYIIVSFSCAVELRTKCMLVLISIAETMKWLFDMHYKYLNSFNLYNPMHNAVVMKLIHFQKNKQSNVIRR